MEWSRYTTCLAVDAARLAEVVDAHMDDKVPTCPEWTGAELVHHLADVYEYVSEVFRLDAEPDGPWPPERGAVPPFTRMRTALGRLLADFTGREAGDRAHSWFEPDQTVGFWARRMGIDTAIHRADAELTAGLDITPIPDDVALGGIGEVLNVFFAGGRQQWPDRFEQALSGANGKPVVIAAGDQAYTVTVKPDDVTVEEKDDDKAAARISGTPSDVLLWLWRRVPDEKVAIEGDTEEAARLYRMLAAFEQ